MTYVVCAYLGILMHGVRVDTQGDQWLVNLGKKTVWINSNYCKKVDK